MQMRYCLPSSSAVIDADVVSLRAELFVGDNLSLAQQCKKFCAFVGFKVKERADMTLGDDQGVPGRDRECVPYDQPQRAGVNHSRLRQATEWARLHFGDYSVWIFKLNAWHLSRGILKRVFQCANTRGDSLEEPEL